MAFNNSFTAVTGATYTAAQYNTHVRDNFTAIWVYTTAGDIAYATSSTTLARLGIGANGYYLESNGSAPTWQQFVRVAGFQLNTDVALGTGEKVKWRVPSALNGHNLIGVAASRASGTGVPSLQYKRNRSGSTVNMLSTALTIDSGEIDSSTAATPAVINTSNDDVATADQLIIEVTAAGTSTLFCFAEFRFAKP